MSASRRVVWDEKNLEDNAEYQRTHPVTMHIDEPKTPYVYDDELDDAQLEEDDNWDPTVNKFAKQVKERVQRENVGAPVAPIGKGGRPMLVPGTATGELENEKQEREFKIMRKAVYADEGAKFKAMLAKQRESGDDEDEDEDDESKDNTGDSDERVEGEDGNKENSRDSDSDEGSDAGGYDY